MHGIWNKTNLGLNTSSTSFVSLDELFKHHKQIKTSNGDTGTGKSCLGFSFKKIVFVHDFFSNFLF